ncbi:MAG: glycosyltransferase, partial [Aquificota bacterium]
MSYKDPYLSVVIPAYNEEENIPILYEKLRKVLENLGREYEVIFVDDGSADHTWERLKEIAERDPKVKLIRFRKNYGQTAAM